MIYDYALENTHYLIRVLFHLFDHSQNAVSCALGRSHLTGLFFKDKLLLA